MKKGKVYAGEQFLLKYGSYKDANVTVIKSGTKYITFKMIHNNIQDSKTVNKEHFEEFIKYGMGIDSIHLKKKRKNNILLII